MRRKFLETRSLPAKDPALMLGTDSTAPVFNDEEKRARATTQEHKVARDRYRFDEGGLAFWADCDRAITLVVGAQHAGSFPHGICQLSHKRFAPKLPAVGAGCKAKVVGRDSFRQPWGITHGPAGGLATCFCPSTRNDMFLTDTLLDQRRERAHGPARSAIKLCSNLPTKGWRRVDATVADGGGRRLSTLIGGQCCADAVVATMLVTWLPARAAAANAVGSSRACGP